MYARLFLLQSAQLLLPSILTKLFSVVRFCSARSAAGLGRRDMVGISWCVRGFRSWAERAAQNSCSEVCEGMSLGRVGVCMFPSTRPRGAGGGNV
jgi:hypothetical protein